MAPGEKEAFTYYRDGVIWYFFRSSPFGKEKVFGNQNFVKEKWKNLRSVKVSSGDRTIPSVVYPRSMQPEMLKSPEDFSTERKVTPMQ